MPTTRLRRHEGRIVTMYGDIEESQLKRFTRITGNYWDDETEEWSLMIDELTHWQLVNPKSTVEAKRWDKKRGTLPVRDLNFQYAHHKNNGDIQKAMDYAEEKLFDAGGNPVYLPEELALKIGSDLSSKPKGYSKILSEILLTLS